MLDFLRFAIVIQTHLCHSLCSTAHHASASVCKNEAEAMHLYVKQFCTGQLTGTIVHPPELFKAIQINDQVLTQCLPLCTELYLVPVTTDTQFSCLCTPAYSDGVQC